MSTIGIGSIAIIILSALVIGFVVDLLVPGKRAWAWLVTMLAAGIGATAAGYGFAGQPYVDDLSLWPALIAALVAAVVVRLALRLTQPTAVRRR